MLRRNFLLALATVVAAVFAFQSSAVADERMELKNDAMKSLDKFFTDVHDGKDFLSKSKGYLVFRSVTSAGLVVVGEYGKGVLFIENKPVDFYSTKAASLGLTAGAQTKSMIIAFMTEEALTKFQKSSGWEVGVDGSVAVAEIGADGSLNTTTTTNKSIVGFVFGQKGLMADLSLEGSKISKIEG